MSTPSGTKRKRNVLPIDVKLEILKQYDKGAKVSSLARKNNLGEQTVRDLIKNREKIQEFVAKSDSLSSIVGRKTVKGSPFKELDDLMLRWYIQKRGEGVAISGPMCTTKAQRFHELLKLPGQFNASNGWLNRFKQRHGIQEMGTQREKPSDYNAGVDGFCGKLQEIIRENDLLDSQIYNADETRLYWRALPMRTLAGNNEITDHDYKDNKDRITVLCCANASGEHKTKLTVVGKSRNPRAFENIDIDDLLPVKYYNESSASMSRPIFEDWFFKQFVPEVRLFLREKNLPEKALLLLDNASSRPEESVLRSEDGNFFTVILPPDVTFIGQPMDEGVIETMKRLYRKELIDNLIGERDLMTFWKSLNIKDAIYSIARAWNGVKAESIQRAFRKVIVSEEDADVQQDALTEVENTLSSHAIKESLEEINGLEGITESEVELWLQCDKANSGYHFLTDEEMVRDVQEKHNASSEELTEDEDGFECYEPAVQPVSHKEAGDAIDIVLNYFEQQTGRNSIDVLHLRSMRQVIEDNQRKEQM